LTLRASTVTLWEILLGRFSVRFTVNKTRIVWFAALILLVVLMVGAIAAGKLSGVESPSLGSINQGQTTGFAEPSTNASRLGGSAPSQLVHLLAGNGSTVLIAGSTPPSLNLAELPFYLFVAIALAAGLALLLRSSSQTTVYDFEAAINQMDKQRSALEGSWSHKLRNAALLRYYSIMRGVCEKLGLPDSPSETPQEYLLRIAEAFRVDVSDARGFAAAFERARYGGELSENEAKEAATHMAKFVDGLRGSIGLA